MDWPWKARSCYPDGQVLKDPSRFMELLVEDMSTNHNQTVHELARLASHVDECFEKMQIQLKLRQSPEPPETTLDVANSLALRRDLQGASDQARAEMVSHIDKHFDGLHERFTELGSNSQQEQKLQLGDTFTTDGTKYDNLVRILGDRFDGQDALIRGLLVNAPSTPMPVTTMRDETGSTIFGEGSLMSDSSNAHARNQGSAAKLEVPRFQGAALSSLMAPRDNHSSSHAPLGGHSPVRDVEAQIENLDVDLQRQIKTLKTWLRSDLAAHHEKIVTALDTKLNVPLLAVMELNTKLTQVEGKLAGSEAHHHHHAQAEKTVQSSCSIEAHAQAMMTLHGKIVHEHGGDIPRAAIHGGDIPATELVIAALTSSVVDKNIIVSATIDAVDGDSVSATSDEVDIDSTTPRHDLEEHAPRTSTSTLSEVMIADSNQAFTRSSFGVHVEIGDLKDAYQVENFYYETGCCQAIARHHYFINTMFAVIGLNCVYIGVDMDWNNAEQLYDAEWVFIISENWFTLAFFLEWVIRFGSFRKKTNFRKDGWMCFDLAMLALMAVETWIMAPMSKALGRQLLPIPSGPLRLVRMVRLVRLSRLLKNVPELVTLTTGLVQGVRASAASIFMIMIFIYVFAIMLHSLLKEEVQLNQTLKAEFGVNFDRLGDCMWVLLIDGTFLLDGTGNILSALVFEGSFSAAAACIIMLMFIFLSAMVICNMLIGVLCEVVGDVTQAERNANDIVVLKDSMAHHLARYDDGDGVLSKEEFGFLMCDPQSKLVFQELQVDSVFMIALSSLFFGTGDKVEMPIAAVIELMLACRGNNPATVHTIAHSLSFLTTRLDHLETDLFSRLEHILDRFGSSTPKPSPKPSPQLKARHPFDHQKVIPLACR